MGKLIALLVLIILSGCSEKANLDIELLYKSRQNIYIQDKMVSLVIYDKWGEDCELLVFDKCGYLIERTKCPTDPIPTISPENDSVLAIIYNSSKNNTVIDRVINLSPIVLNSIKTKNYVVHNYCGEQMGESVYYDSSAILKKDNLVGFFLEGRLILILKTDELFSAYGELKYRTIKNDLLIYHPLQSKNVSINDYYKEVIECLKK